MVDISTYKFKHLTDTKVKPEESFIIVYVYKCLKSEGTISSTRRIHKHLDLKYQKYDLNKVMGEQCQHLIPNKQEKILHILEKKESLSNGTLGTWKTPPVTLDLKDDATPMCSRPYTVPRVHKAVFRKEVKRLLKSDVTEEANDSEWGAPYFAQSKPKRSSVIFLSEFRNLNRQLKRNPYPIPKIREMLLNLEGFQYPTSLELIMGYYHIRLSDQASNLFTIIIPRRNIKGCQWAYINPWKSSKRR